MAYILTSERQKTTQIYIGEKCKGQCTAESLFLLVE